jgi:hypothetical protein
MLIVSIERVEDFEEKYNEVAFGKRNKINAPLTPMLLRGRKKDARPHARPPVLSTVAET